MIDSFILKLEKTHRRPLEKGCFKGQIERGRGSGSVGPNLYEHRNGETVRRRLCCRGMGLQIVFVVQPMSGDMDQIVGLEESSYQRYIGGLRESGA